MINLLEKLTKERDWQTAYKENREAICIQGDYIMAGEVLQDTKDGRERPWEVKKLKSLDVAGSFSRLGMDGRARRVSDCGSWLKFMECAYDEHKKLVGANFCRDRLCPMCNWRRSRLLAGQIVDMLHVALKRRKMRFIFLTLTVRNVTGDELETALKCLYDGFDRMFRQKAVKRNLVGWCRALEVTYSVEEGYHPHFHVLIGVDYDYFRPGQYITQADWTAIWQGAAGLDYKPVVDVRAVRPKGNKTSVEAAASEAMKYTVKDSDYIRDTEAETDSVISVLAAALKGRRLIGFGGLFKTIRAELGQADVESSKADLVAADGREPCQCPICGSSLKEQLYSWNVGASRYVSK